MSASGGVSVVLGDLLHSLLGFTGDIIVSEVRELSLQDESAPTLGDIFESGSFKVKDGYNGLSEAERDQINRIAPLGRYFVCFEEYVKHYTLRWRQDPRPYKLYCLAIAGSIQDMIQEYVGDVAQLEVEIMQSAPLPISYVMQRVQKYSIVFPQLFSLLKLSEESRLNGCQLVELFAQHVDGLPAIAAVMQRILARLHAVTIRQIFVWMIFGDLSDPASEFFIRSKEISSRSSSSSLSHQEEMLFFLALQSATNSGTNESIAVSFAQHSSKARSVDSSINWANFFLQMDFIPSSLLTPTVASKVLFAGKATLLMRQVDAWRKERPEAFQRNECLQYMSRGAPRFRRDRSDQLGAFSDQDIDRFDKEFDKVQSAGYQRVAPVLSAAISHIADNISTRLWYLICEELDFFLYLQVARSIYLLGKGEVMQSILDHLLTFVHDPALSTTGIDQLNSTLGRKILPTVMKLLGVENEESVSRLFTLAISSSSVELEVWDDAAMQLVQLVGSCAPAYPKFAPSNPVAASIHEQGLFLPEGVEMCAVQQLPFAEVLVRSEQMDLELSAALDLGNSAPSYLNGAVWLQENKNVAKGMNLKAEFSLPWSSSQRYLRPSLISGNLETEVVLSTVAIGMQYDPRAQQVVGSGALSGGVENALFATATFLVRVGVDSKIRRFVKLAIRKSPRARMLAASLQLRMFSTAVAENAMDLDVLADKLVELDADNSLNTIDEYVLSVEYSRHMSYERSDAKSAVSLKGSVSYKLRAVLSHRASAGGSLELDTLLDMKDITVCSSAGLSTVGVVASGLVLERIPITSPQPSEIFVLSDAYYQSVKVFSPVLHRVRFASAAFSSGSALAYPACSAYTRTHHPETYLALDALVSRYRLVFSSMQAQVLFPSFLRIFFDAEICRQYERIFQLICKVRAAGYGLERLWISGSKSPNEGASKSAESIDRRLSSIRHSMHFFISNFLYYLQVDVVDSEYDRLIEMLRQCDDFQAALNGHRHFVATLVHLSWLDQLGLQETIDRIVQLCWRFLAASKLLNDSYSFGFSYDQQSKYNLPHIVPIEEFNSIAHDFYQQVHYLVFMMRSTETRGFLFRLDFNGFLSELKAKGLHSESKS